MVTIDDVRRLAVSLPRTEEHLIRDQVKFRVGRIVYLAFSRDEEIMGFGFPKEERDALVAAEPAKFLMPRQSDLRYRWVCARLAAIDEAEMHELVVDAWRMCVPKKVAAALRPRTGQGPLSAADMNRRLGRGINFGNILDVPRGSEPRLRLRQRHFDVVRQAGFDTVRLPAKWSAHAAADPPHTIDPAFFDRVDDALAKALDRDLNVVLNVHHYDELYDAPAAHEARFLALWRQIGARYADRSDRLYFELLNEPRKPMTPEQWNDLLPRALAAVRESNPSRVVIVGPARMNTVEALPGLDLPDDERLVATVHYYSPFAFTHQGAGWAPGSDQWLDTSWGTDAEREAVRGDLTKAAAWAREHGRPLFMGEFGTYERADMAARAAWTSFVRSEAERLDMSWAYWDFGTDFGAFDPRRGTWQEPLRKALLTTE